MNRVCSAPRPALLVLAAILLAPLLAPLPALAGVRALVDGTTGRIELEAEGASRTEIAGELSRMLGIEITGYAGSGEVLTLRATGDLREILGKLFSNRNYLATYEDGRLSAIDLLEDTNVTRAAASGPAVPLPDTRGMSVAPAQEDGNPDDPPPTFRIRAPFMFGQPPPQQDGNVPPGAGSPQRDPAIRPADGLDELRRAMQGLCPTGQDC